MSITKKSRKDEIWAAYEEAQAQLDAFKQVGKTYKDGFIMRTIDIRRNRIEARLGKEYIRVYQPQDQEMAKVVEYLERPEIVALEQPCTADTCNNGWFNEVKGQICFSCYTGRWVGKLGVMTIIDQRGQGMFNEAKAGRTGNRTKAMEKQAPEKPVVLNCGDCGEPMPKGMCIDCTQKADLPF